MSRITTFMLAALAYGALEAQAPAISWGPQMDLNTSSTGNLRPRIVLNGSGSPVVVWGNMGDMHNYAAVGNGASFSTPVDLHPPGVMGAMANWMGADVAAEGNSIWMVFKASPEQFNPMYAVHSNDGGYTWDDTLRIDPANDVWSRFPTVSTGPPDGPMVQYMQFESGFLGARQVVSRMIGGVFQPAVQVSAPYAPNEVCDCCPGQLVSNPDAAIALYRNNGFNVRTIWGATSLDQGADFPNGAEIDPTGWVISSCPASGPDGYVAGDSARYVWMSGALDGTKIYISSAHLPELTSGMAQRVHLGVPITLQQNYPRIAGSGDTLGVVWQQLSGGDRNVLFSWSVSGINGLSAPDTISTLYMGQQETPDIAYANGTFHFVWSDLTDDVVRYRSATIISSVLVPERNAQGALDAWPLPASDQLFIRTGDLRPAYFRVLDARGRPVLDVPGAARSVDISTLAPGPYRLLAFDGSDGMTASCPIVVMR